MPKRWWASTFHERPTSRSFHDWRAQRVETVMSCVARRAQGDETVTISLIRRTPQMWLSMALRKSLFQSLSCGTPWLFVAVCGSPWLFVALRGSPWLSMSLCGSLWPSVTLPCLSVPLFASPWLSMSLCGSLWHSVALCGSPCLSVALRASPCVSVALCSLPWLSVTLGVSPSLLCNPFVALRGSLWCSLPP